ncbi:tetratricopeptide repeat protein [Halioxenophilus sp. WMMB6]|uniref:tetratricopeptide repeat protein n=1 Tax=Halioxenophilus sp. WMMB6 TaxID=3073815 RepID=UPI00295EB09D|nr:tetratricopeptide repeat protein [Halioxenophilus sp. WMMB6]
MKHLHKLILVTAPLALAGCAITDGKDTLASLRNTDFILQDATVEDGLEKAMDSYRVFLEETPETAMTPDAIRRIADLSIEREYGYVGTDDSHAVNHTARSAEPMASPTVTAAASANSDTPSSNISNPNSDESVAQFEERASQSVALANSDTETLAEHPGAASDLENASARQAIALYTKLLKEYPLYDRNDQVLYQMSRAYEELGENDNAMAVMNQFIETYPNSRYLDEIQFRRAEFFFVRKKYYDAEQAYNSIVQMGSTSYYYELALYKLGWSFYKQQMYDEALEQFIAVLDYKVSTGYDFNQEHDQIEGKRVDDTFRVISLSFSNLGGPEVVVDLFNQIGGRTYEDKVYSNLGEFYLDKRRYADAAGAYKAFIAGHPYHEVAPQFFMRTIEIFKAGRFAQLVIDAKKEFAETYALNAAYWQYYDYHSRPEVVDYLKGNLTDLANHYHALYQDARFEKEKPANYAEALVWYRKFLASFPSEQESPHINYQMADLMLENQDFRDAAVAYEFTAYNYPAHEQSSEAGYNAVYSYREYLKSLAPESAATDSVKQEVIRTSLRFADTYPEHEKVALVLSAAADDLYDMKNYELAVNTAYKLINNHPTAEQTLTRAAWLVVGHGSFDLNNYAEAEKGYSKVLSLTASNDESRTGLYDNLAAAIYNQGEQARTAGDFQLAADHYLRVSKLAPTSSIRPTAEFDAASALIELQNWSQATDVLLAFRDHFPKHDLQKEITKKIAFVYKSSGQLELAAGEYERIESEADDEEVRRGALLLAAELYQEAGVTDKEVAVYKRFISYFPAPIENVLEVYSKLAGAYELSGDGKSHTATLLKIVALDKGAGKQRTDRTRYLAAGAALTLAKPNFDKFKAVAIVEPIKKNLDKKKKLMKIAIEAYSDLVDYEVADITAAATYYMAEIYYDFSRALANSERPSGLSDLELEEYELALEDQIFPFEEKAISVHRKNIELLYIGVYSNWIDKSIGKLADLFPAIYARDEEHTGFVETIDSYFYAIKEPEAAPVAPAPGAESSQASAADSAPTNAGTSSTEIPESTAENDNHDQSQALDNKNVIALSDSEN